MFIIMEMQTSNGTTSIVQPRTYSDRRQAESAFYTALASAAVSSVDVHAVVLLNEHGDVLMTECYEHGA